MEEIVVLEAMGRRDIIGCFCPRGVDGMTMGLPGGDDSSRHTMAWRTKTASMDDNIHTDSHENDEKNSRGATQQYWISKDTGQH